MAKQYVKTLKKMILASKWYPFFFAPVLVVVIIVIIAVAVLVSVVVVAAIEVISVVEASCCGVIV